MSKTSTNAAISRVNGVRNHRRRTAVVIAAASAVLVALPASAALAGTGSGSGSGSNPVILGPTLGLLTFGDAIGLPLACQDGSSAIGAGAEQYNLGKYSGALITAINNDCTLLQNEGAKYIALGQKDDQKASALNPYLDPMIASTGKSVQEAGTTYGPALAPFGPTIAGLGGTIDFFEGS